MTQPLGGSRVEAAGTGFILFPLPYSERKEVALAAALLGPGEGQPEGGAEPGGRAGGGPEVNVELPSARDWGEALRPQAIDPVPSASPALAGVDSHSFYVPTRAPGAPCTVEKDGEGFEPHEQVGGRFPLVWGRLWVENRSEDSLSSRLLPSADDAGLGQRAEHE